MTLDPKLLFHLLTHPTGAITHAVVRDSVTGSKSLMLNMHEMGGMGNPDPNRLAMRLYKFYPHNKYPACELYNRDIMQSEIVDGELHIPHREIIISFHKLIYVPVMLGVSDPL